MVPAFEIMLSSETVTKTSTMVDGETGQRTKDRGIRGVLLMLDPSLPFDELADSGCSRSSSWSGLQWWGSTIINRVWTYCEVVGWKYSNWPTCSDFGCLLESVESAATMTSFFTWRWWRPSPAVTWAVAPNRYNYRRRGFADPSNNALGIDCTGVTSHFKVINELHGWHVNFDHYML